MKKDVLSEKSLDFAVKILKLTKRLQENREFIVSSQIGKSGTSIGANIRESHYAQGRKDFISKLEIASKEANETMYWLEVLLRCEYIEKNEFEELNGECAELLSILSASCCTAKSNLP